MLLNCGVGEDSWVPWTARRSIQSILKEVSSEYSLEELMPNLKLQYFGHLMRRTDSLEDPDAGKDCRQKKGTTEDEMAGWHHRLDGHEFEQALGTDDGQGSLVCCSPWGVTKSRTQLRDWTKTYPSSHFAIQILYHFTLHLTPEANIMFYVNNTSILKNGII